MSTNYLCYSDNLEKEEPNEQKTITWIVETLRGISETTFKDSGYPLRSVHAKSHALLYGEFAVLENIPAFLRQGMFKSPGTYQVAISLSTAPGDVLQDSVSTPRGLAVKVVGVHGGRLPGSGSATTQDFVLVNGPAFQAPNAKAFLKSLKMLAATKEKAEGFKKAASVIWPEDKSPYITVAKITVQPQTGWSKQRSVSFDEGLVFSPWHGLAAHRPLGSVMRARKPAYEMSALAPA